MQADQGRGGYTYVGGTVVRPSQSPKDLQIKNHFASECLFAFYLVPYNKLGRSERPSIFDFCFAARQCFLRNNAPAKRKQLDATRIDAKSD
jgi:hypothetical protein